MTRSASPRLENSAYRWVSMDMPQEAYLLMNLYPQARQRRPSAQYIPLPYASPVRERDRRQGNGSAR